jgi:hypothetical protein
MKRKLFIAVGSLASLGFAAGSGSAANISYTYIATPQSGSIVNGTANVLNVYLDETVPAGATSPIPGSGGLFGGGVAIVENAGGTGVTLSSPLVNTLASPAGFDSPAAGGTAEMGLSTGSTPGAYLIGITSLGDTVEDAPAKTSIVSGVTTNLYLLGTVTFNVGTSPNATFNIESIHDAPKNDGILDAGSTGNTIDANGDDLDVGGPVAGSGTLTGADGHPTLLSITSPTPEPGSLALCGLAAGAMALRRRKARH